MTEQELVNLIKEKRRGKKVSTVEQAEMLDVVLTIGERMADNNLQIMHLSKQVSEDRAVLSDINMYFPILYREAKRIFMNPKPKEDVLDTVKTPRSNNKKTT